MATPTVAGNAILIKQYFQDGWFPSGSRTPANSFVPSGALLKAMLVHSGVQMDLVTYDNDNGLYQQSTGGYPSNIQGYGRIRLSNVLNFGASSANPLTLFVRGAVETSSPFYAALTSPSQVDSYSFQTSSSSETALLRVTLAYTDEFAVVGSAITLINALSINVTTGSVSDGTFRSYSPYLAEDIGLNNLLMVDIPSPSSNTLYTVQVSSVDLNSVQPYALGEIALVPFSFSLLSLYIYLLTSLSVSLCLSLSLSLLSVVTGQITAAKWNSTSSSDSSSLSNSISPTMRRTIAILCLVIILFGALLALITYQLRRALRLSEETYDADEEDDAHSHHTRNTRQSNATRNGNRDIEHRELTEREIQMISRRS
jgi:hypothetical protein